MKNYPRINLQKNESVIFITTFNEQLNSDSWNTYLNYFPNEVQCSILKYRKWEDQYNALFGKLLIYVGFYILLDKKIDLINIKRSIHGKPYIDNYNLKFNISHSSNTVVCAFAFHDIGIDIEVQTNMDFSIYKNFFSEQEMIEIEKSGYLKFYEYWTKKEAISKAIGNGLSMHLSKMNTIEDTIKFENKIFQIKKFILADKYCSLASEEEMKKINFIRVSF